MRVTITSAESSGDGTRVLFSSEKGEGCAYWCGPPPIPGVTYFAELDSDDALIFGENATALNHFAEGLSVSESGTIRICGKLAVVTKEGTGIFHIGDGQIELDLVDPTPWNVGLHYELQLSSVTLFDQNY